ncbi:MAG: diguanylate cyclase [Candidatus Binatia bacterium]
MHRHNASDTLAQELAVINEMTKAVTSTLNLAEIVRILLQRIKTVVSAEAISLLRYDAERDELVFVATETLRDSTLDDRRSADSLAAWVGRTGRSALVNEAAHDPRGADPLAAGGGRHLLAVPLRRGERVVGVIELADRYDGAPFDPADQRALETAAAGLAAEIDPARLAVDGAAVHRLLAEVGAAVPSQSAALLLYDPDGRGLVFSASRQLQAGVIDGVRIPTGVGIAGWVARQRQALRLDDASADPRYNRAIEAFTKFRPRSMLCVPVVSRNVLLGVIQVMNRLDGQPFDDHQFQLVQILADHAAIAMQNAALYRQAQVAAVTDDLTGLGNSRQLSHQLPELIAAGRQLTLLVLDFDNFKQVVDRYGHLIGSQTIAFLGRLIAQQLRPGDLASRFGGDEFAIILPNSSVAAACDVAEQIRAAIAAAQCLDSGDVDISAVTASVGIAVFPDHAQDANALLRLADQAMYAVKRARKNGVGVAGSGFAQELREPTTDCAD